MILTVLDLSLFIMFFLAVFSLDRKIKNVEIKISFLYLEMEDKLKSIHSVETEVFLENILEALDSPGAKEKLAKMRAKMQEMNI
jgi:hypothetical protein